MKPAILIQYLNNKLFNIKAESTVTMWQKYSFIHKPFTQLYIKCYFYLSKAPLLVLKYGMCYPTEKSKWGDSFFFLSGAGLNSSEAINVFTSQDCSDMSLHSFETNKHPQDLPTVKKSWGGECSENFWDKNSLLKDTGTKVKCL